MSVKPRSNRYFVVTTSDNGDIIEIGPASTPNSVAVMSIQFDPSIDFVGSLIILGRLVGTAASAAPFLPIPYRRVNVAGTASDRLIVSDAIDAVGKIEVPSNGDSVGVLVACTAGTCAVYSWDLQGTSN